jgi:hypothetical protein
MTLVEFLRARLDEDEQVACAATPGPWRVRVDGPDDESYVWADNGGRYGDGSPVTFHPDGAPRHQGAIGDEDARHVARHDPTRALREVEAKRGLMTTIEDDPFDAMGAEWQYEVLVWSYLALPYVDHPDYQPEWTPTNTPV